MNFKQATDGLFARVSHEDLAGALGVSIASIRQARLAEKALAHRSPPQAWEKVVAQLARNRARRLERLAARLEGHD